MAFELAQLFEDVRGWFAEPARSALGVSVVYGRRSPPRQDNQGEGTANRVCFVHGKPKGGNAFDVVGEKENGDIPRNLMALDAIGYVEIWAVDLTDISDEAKQVRAAWSLAEYAFTGIRAKVRTDFRVSEPEWVTEPNERPYGATLRMGIKVRSFLVERFESLSLAGGTLGFSFANKLGSEAGCEHDQPPPEPEDP
jgi:hypothetical protein